MNEQRPNEQRSEWLIKPVLSSLSHRWALYKRDPYMGSATSFTETPYGYFKTIKAATEAAKHLDHAVIRIPRKTP